ncbi:peptidase domain-containing ABC transporter [Serratia sp. JUb9]|uniref:peptidase domain-containing ABC transporter n=1 Tax=unclassified Serratia (in: enterobacteria) TaxID=2647522 RepID=UPI00164DEDF6|nr:MULTISPECIES: peptidase domain-containing ABC transporter [unclassified Serratia (in: enterobacteria)]MBU3893370.1 peptidase domain-containing ABC transporter [Serratia rubidaea]MCA4824084.1 peptidase domain-containing ABC transporter [Serratia rubidaea]QNK33070.1 peptidase domain-containing ABC transporter [Serratia sp. JUb9]QPT13354.1 peptidase domain-containing ABC transporter [Serratia rubidaea]CAE1150282.1 putative microcin-H47 secretion/processing ATP-binding protein MchF [Serratia sp
MEFLKNLHFGFGRRLPVIQQSQAAECGLACVAMVVNYYKYNIDMISLRRRFSTSMKGATLADVMRVAGSLGMAGRALRLEIEELDKLRRPCILHWNLNHFVVLKKVKKNAIIIHDPASGVRVVSMKEVSNCFTGVALELLPSASFKPAVEKQSLSMFRLIGSVTGIGAALTQILLLSVALEVFGVITPFYMQWVMDQVLVSDDRDLLTLLSVGFIFVFLFQNLITALRSWVMTWFSSLLNVQWTTNVCSHLLGLPLSFFESRHVGDIISRFGSVSTIQETLTTRFISSVLDGIMAIVTLGVLFTYNRMLTAVVVLQFLLYAAIRWIAYRPFRNANEDHIITAAKAQSILLESVRGAKTLKLNNRQDIRVSSYANALVETTNKNIVVQRLSIGFSTIHGIIASIGRIALVWLAALQVLDGNFSAGMLIGFMSFADQFISRGSGLVDAWIDFRMLRLHGERLADIVLTEQEKDGRHEAEGPGNVSPQPPTITLDNVSFRYAETEPMILDSCSFEIGSGESVALIGPSGQGKTTLAKLLLGLLQPVSGRILIDGVDIQDVGLYQYRERIGCVMQDDILFAGSIADNICFFSQEADQERIEQAAKIAQIHDDIMKMPMTYQSLVGDMGSSLSGGQNQRVLLARALYRNPSILVLDEASSHLDVEREMRINDAIRNMAITRIIIAHRPETIRSAGRIVMLSDGKAQPVNPETLAPF